MMIQASEEKVKNLFQVFREVPHKKKKKNHPEEQYFQEEFYNTFQRNEDSHSMIKALKVIKWDVSPLKFERLSC